MYSTLHTCYGLDPKTLKEYDTQFCTHRREGGSAPRSLEPVARAALQQMSRAKGAAGANLASKHDETKRCTTKQRHLCPTNTGNQQTLRRNGSTNVPLRTNKNNLAKKLFFSSHYALCGSIHLHRAERRNGTSMKSAAGKFLGWHVLRPMPHFASTFCHFIFFSSHGNKAPRVKPAQCTHQPNLSDRSLFATPCDCCF